MRLRLIAGLSLAMLLSCPAIAVEQGFLGEWQVDTQIEMMGMMMPGQTYQRCVSKDDLVATPDMGKDCKVINFKIVKNTVTWQMTCTIQNQPAHIDGIASYFGNHMKSTVNIESLGINMVTHGVGKRLGNCVKK